MLLFSMNVHGELLGMRVDVLKVEVSIMLTRCKMPWAVMVVVTSIMSAWPEVE